MQVGEIGAIGCENLFMAAKRHTLFINVLQLSENTAHIALKMSEIFSCLIVGALFDSYENFFYKSLLMSPLSPDTDESL